MDGTKSLGQVAFEANHDKDVSFESLRPELKAGWENAAQAVKKTVIETAVNAPFLAGLNVEEQYQQLIWGTPHDREKTPHAWYWLLAYLAGKAVTAQQTGDFEKAMHHTISSAAMLSQWHQAIEAQQQEETQDE